MPKTGGINILPINYILDNIKEMNKFIQYPLIALTAMSIYIYHYMCKQRRYKYQNFVF